jgi:hypothetical protein
VEFVPSFTQTGARGAPVRDTIFTTFKKWLPFQPRVVRGCKRRKMFFRERKKGRFMNFAGKKNNGSSSFLFAEAILELGTSLVW